MSNIVLSGGVRASLLHLQEASELIARTQTPSTLGGRGNSTLENPITAWILSACANDLHALLEAMSIGIDTIQRAINGISAITRLAQSAQALARQAQQTVDSALRATLANQFDSLLLQIDECAHNACLNGVNLLRGNDLIIKMNKAASPLMAVTSFDATTAGDLAIKLSCNHWATNPDTQPVETDLRLALVTLRSQARCLVSSLSTMEVRQDFAIELINVLRTGVDTLVVTDNKAERTNLLALQTRQQVAITALSSAAQSGQNVLRLFWSST